MSLPLLLLPGMMCDARLFGPQIEALAPRREIVVPLPTGHDDMAALAAEILRRAPGRFALAGLSMGGIVAMEIVRQAPGRVDRLALIDTNPLAEADAVRARRAPQIETVRQGRLAEVIRDEMKPHYLAHGPGRQAILDLCMDMALDLGAGVFCRQSRALRDRPDQQDTLRRYRGETLILCGREDALCPVARHELMHDLVQGSDLKIIEGAGHLPTLEQPEATTRALARWLEA